MTIFGVSNSAKDLDIPCLVKFKGSITFWSDPLVNFNGVTKGVQIVQRGSLDTQTRKNATFAFQPPLLKIGADLLIKHVFLKFMAHFPGILTDVRLRVLSLNDHSARRVAFLGMDPVGRFGPLKLHFEINQRARSKFHGIRDYLFNQ